MSAELRLSTGKKLSSKRLKPKSHMHINLFTRPSHWTFWEGGISTLDVGFIGKNAIKDRVFPIDEKNIKISLRNAYVTVPYSLRPFTLLQNNSDEKC